MPDLFNSGPLVDDDDWDEEHNDLLSLKHSFDGATTITELTGALRGLANELDRQRTEGWRLAAPVDGGHVHLTRDPL